MTGERTTPFRLSIPATGGAVAVREFLEKWTASPALTRLVQAARGPAASNGSLTERLRALYAFSEIWDFRRGGERLDIGEMTIGVPEATIGAAARDLGMAVTLRPNESRYDHTLILGGTALACYLRIKYTRTLADEGVDLNHIAGLGALREISDQERALLVERSDVQGEQVDTEFDALLSAAVRFFPPQAAVERAHTPAEHENLETAFAGFKDRDGRTLEIVAAPSSEPDVRRANTVDNYKSYSKTIGDGDSVLLVTSSIYAPYQFFVALRALGWERPLTIELVGFPPEWLGGVLTSPQNYLQETRSALSGALSLAEAVAA